MGYEKATRSEQFLRSGIKFQSMIIFVYKMKKLLAVKKHLHLKSTEQT